MRVEVPHKGAKVYIYTRVSTEMQVEGYSLDAQKVEILKEVRRHDMVVAGEYTDEGRSGKSIVGRDGFQQMLDDIVARKDDVSFVLVYKLSRFAVLLVVVGAKQILINTLGTAFFFRLHLTIVPCVLMIPILVGIAYVIPKYQFEKMSQESVVERIRKE